MGQALTGKRNSIPKQTKVLANDSKKMLYRKMGNGHIVPFLWAETVSLNGTSEVVVASGIVYGGTAVASACITATPTSNISATYYIDKDTVNNVVYLRTSAAVTADFDVHIYLGD